jgi:hypothetical protein
LPARTQGSPNLDGDPDATIIDCNPCQPRHRSLQRGTLRSFESMRGESIS